MDLAKVARARAASGLKVKGEDGTLWYRVVSLGLGRIVALCYRSSILYQVYEHIRCL